MYSPNGKAGGFVGVSAFEQRMNEVVGILCGTPHDEGLIHVTRRTADTVDKLGEGLSRTERAITDLADETRTAISGLASQVKSSLDITATQGTRLSTLETKQDGEKDKLLGWLVGLLSWVASRGFVVVVSAAAIVWTYLYTVTPHAPFPR